MPPSTAPPVRHSFGDDLFLRRHRGLGAPVHNQFAWRFDRSPALAEVEGLLDRLAAGGLGRRARRALVPGARGRWCHEGLRPPLVRTLDLDPADVLDWLRARGEEPRDPVRGHGWAPALAALRGGGAVLSLVVSHAVADGGAMVDAVHRAATDRPLPAPSAPGLVASLREDLADAVDQGSQVARWAARRIRSERSAAAPPAAAPAAPTAAAAPTPPDWRVPLVVAEVPTAAIEASAARDGGTPNAWFTAVVAGVARRVRPGTGPVPVALPVSVRADGDRQGNATRIAQVHLDPDAGPAGLAEVRAACKAAYARLAASSGAEPVPLALVQMLPDALVRRLPAPPPAAALASRVGELPEEFLTVGGVRARAVAAMAHQAGAEAAQIRALGGGITAWSCTSGPVTTLSFAALDPDRVPDDAALGEALRTELGRWDVTGRLW